MRAYVIKRLLLMIPTFFGISLIVFIILNFAPGHPGGTKQSTDIASQVRGQKSAESHRIFREQFNLDKPVLFNTRYALEDLAVRENLVLLTDAADSTAAQKIRAHETLEDYGQYSVPHLIRLLESETDVNVRDLAAYFLRLNARRPLIKPFKKHPSEELRAKNQEIDVENALIRDYRYALEDGEEKKLEVIELWLAWFGERRQRWDYSTRDKFRIFFLETRFATYWANLVKLDWGVSLVSREPVIGTLVSKLKYSLTLSIGSILLAYLISIPLGVHSAVNRNTITDRTLTVVLFMLYSLPSFFVATVLLILFSEASRFEVLRWFPTGGWRSTDAMQLTTLAQLRDIGWHLVLPMICLTYNSLAVLSRFMRTGMLNEIGADYIRTARAKGLTEWTVIMKHALRNGLIPILTLLASLLPAALGGSVIIEYIFGIPGMGLWMIDSIYQRDYNVIMAISLLSTILVLFGILLSDLSYALVDPRIRFK